jgi:hypothetical protein
LFKLDFTKIEYNNIISDEVFRDKRKNLKRKTTEGISFITAMSQGNNTDYEDNRKENSLTVLAPKALARRSVTMIPDF